MAPHEYLRGVFKFCNLHQEIFPNTNIPAYIRQYGMLDGKFLNEAEAWGLVQKTIRWWNQQGYEVKQHHKKPPFSDDLVGQAVDVLGWSEIYECKNPEVTRSHFFKIYKGLLEAEKRKVLERVVE